MKKKSQNGLYIAFDIGTVSIKAAVIELTERGQRLAAIEEELLKPISAYPGEEEFRQQLIQALKNLATRLPIQQCCEVSALFANRELQIKIIELPAQVQPDQIEKLLNWEAKKLLSPAFREEPFAFSYKILRKNPYTVALTVVPERLLERFTELFEKAGINLSGAYPEVYGAHELKEIVDISGLPALSIVNFGHSGTHLQIFSAGELKFYRFIPSGMADMSDPPTEGELEMYSQKIRFSFDYFRAVSKLNQIDILYFMGGGAAQPGVLPFERSYFNPTRVNIVDISSGLDISPVMPELTDNQPAEERQRRLLAYIPTVGACLAGLAEDAGSMNLTGRLKNKRRELKMEKLAGLLPIWITAACLVLSVILLLASRNSMKAELDTVNSQLGFLKMNTDAAMIKLSKHRATTETQIKLSPQARKVLEPVMKARTATADALFHTIDKQPAGLRTEEILVRTELEAESISLGSQVEASPQTDEPEQEPTSPYVTRLSPETGDEQQLREGLKGEILIIRGNADTPAAVGQYAENLIGRKAIKRIRSLNTRKGRASGIEFLLKGELP